MSSPFGGGSPFSGGGGGASASAASETVAGIVELATQAEVDAGTDAERVVTPDTLEATTLPSRNLKSATTSIDVASATAPTSGQVLTATGSTAATWQTPASAGVSRTRLYSTIEPRGSGTNMSTSGVPIFAVDGGSAVVSVSGEGIAFRHNQTAAGRVSIETQAAWHQLEDIPVLDWRMEVDSVPTAYQISLGWTESSGSTLTAAADPGTNHIGIQFDSAGDTNWMWVHRGAGAQVRADSGYAYTTGETLLFLVDCVSATEWHLAIYDKTGTTLHAETTITSDIPAADTNFEFSCGGQWVSGTGTLRIHQYGGHVGCAGWEI